MNLTLLALFPLSIVEALILSKSGVTRHDCRQMRAKSAYSFITFHSVLCVTENTPDVFRKKRLLTMNQKPYSLSIRRRIRTLIINHER